jgi:hypothetical protein
MDIEEGYDGGKGSSSPMPRLASMLLMHAMWAGPGIVTPSSGGSPRRVTAESKINMLVRTIR